MSELADVYYPRVRRFAAYAAATDSDADDIAQEAMIAAIGSRLRYDPRRGSVDAWLWHIVVSRGRELGRLARRQSLLFDRVSYAWSTPDNPDLDPAALALERITEEDLVATVRRLPKHYRTLIALRYGADLPVAEVASTLGITRMAAAKGIGRAVARLRKELRP